MDDPLTQVDQTTQSSGALSAEVRFRTSPIDRVIGPLGESLDYSTHLTWDEHGDGATEVEIVVDSTQSVNSGAFSDDLESKVVARRLTKPHKK